MLASCLQQVQSIIGIILVHFKNILKVFWVHIGSKSGERQGEQLTNRYLREGVHLVMKYGKVHQMQKEKADFCIESALFIFVMRHSSHRNYPCTRWLVKMVP
jgi:hypothetical protein